MSGPGPGEVRVRQPGDGGHGAITTKVLDVNIKQNFLHLGQTLIVVKGSEKPPHKVSLF